VIDGAVLNFIDISPIRQAERRLREGEANLRMVVQSTQDYAIITTDRDGRSHLESGRSAPLRLPGGGAVGQSIEISSRRATVATAFRSAR